MASVQATRWAYGNYLGNQMGPQATKWVYGICTGNQVGNQLVYGVCTGNQESLRSPYRQPGGSMATVQATR